MKLKKKKVSSLHTITFTLIHHLLLHSCNLCNSQSSYCDPCKHVSRMCYILFSPFDPLTWHKIHISLPGIVTTVSLLRMLHLQFQGTALQFLFWDLLAFCSTVFSLECLLIASCILSWWICSAWVYSVDCEHTGHTNLHRQCSAEQRTQLEANTSCFWKRNTYPSSCQAHLFLLWLNYRTWWFDAIFGWFTGYIFPKGTVAPKGYKHFIYSHKFWWGVFLFAIFHKHLKYLPNWGKLIHLLSFLTCCFVIKL